jgi:hypothetical protein
MAMASDEGPKLSGEGSKVPAHRRVGLAVRCFVLLATCACACTAFLRQHRTAVHSAGGVQLEATGNSWMSLSPSLKLLEEAELARTEERAVGLEAAISLSSHQAPTTSVVTTPSVNEITSTPSAVAKGMVFDTKAAYGADVPQLEKQLAAIRALKLRARRDRKEEAQMKATLQAQINADNAAQGHAHSSSPSKSNLELVNSATSHAEAHGDDPDTTRKGLQAQSVSRTQRLSRLEQIEEQMKPKVRKWREEEINAWKKEQDEMQAAKKEARAQEIHKLKVDLKQEAEARLRTRLFKGVEHADRKVANTLTSDPVSSLSPEQQRRRREVQAVEWREAQEQASNKAAASRNDEQSRVLRRVQKYALQRKQAEKQWSHLVKMALGDSALAKQARQNTKMYSQNLAAYMESGPDQPAEIQGELNEQSAEESGANLEALEQAPGFQDSIKPHIWASAQEEVG